MPKSFPKNVFLEGIFTPCQTEFNLDDLQVIGTIPAELNGIFYRNGPNPDYVYSKNYHMYEGDGMIHAMSFTNGRVSYQNRWIRTERFLAQRKAGKALFGGMRDRLARDPEAKAIAHNTANTNVVWHHDRLLALNEGGLPVVLEPKSLETLALTDFNPVLDRSMTAHPKIDPKTGEMLFYSYLSPHMDFVYFIADAQGRITHRETLILPFLSLLHDFAITEHFTIIPLFPLTLDYKRFAQGDSIFKWEPDRRTHFAILPRYGKNEDIIFFEDVPCLSMHTVNAFEQGDELILDMVGMHDIPEGLEAFVDDALSLPNHLVRWTFNLKTRQLQKQKRDSTNMEFPRIDERFTGQPYRHTYLASSVHLQAPFYFFDSITHFDAVNQTKAVHYLGENAISLEPIFVPKSANAKEGEGFVIFYVYRKQEQRSDLMILDAQNIAGDPLAIIQLPHAVPFGFHGCWVDIHMLN